MLILAIIQKKFNKMRNIKIKLVFSIGVLLVIMGCSQEDSIIVNSTPEFVSLEENISSLPGETFKISGVVSDPAGIKSVNFIYKPWFLDKTIVKDSVPNSYTISYQFKVPDDAIEPQLKTLILF